MGRETITRQVVQFKEKDSWRKVQRKGKRERRRERERAKQKGGASGRIKKLAESKAGCRYSPRPKQAKWESEPTGHSCTPSTATTTDDPSAQPSPARM
jgi:hypothetical protein